MNQIFSNLAAAKGNPHVLWPLVAAMILRVTISALRIWIPEHQAQIDQTKAALDPVITGLIGLATIGAANSAPSGQPSNTQPMKPTS